MSGITSKVAARLLESVEEEDDTKFRSPRSQNSPQELKRFETLGMPKIRTAISLQGSLVERLDKLARELNVSRSQLFSRAADEFLRRHETPALLEAINRALEDDPDPSEKARVHAMRNKQRRLVEGEW